MKTLITFLVLLVSSMGIASETESLFLENHSIEFTQKISPFCMAIVKGDTEAVKRFIKLGTDVNRTSNDMTPLMYAARFNRVEMIMLLVENGARINIKNSIGRNAIDFAELSNATEALQALRDSKSGKKTSI